MKFAKELEREAVPGKDLALVFLSFIAISIVCCLPRVLLVGVFFLGGSLCYF